MWLYTAWLISLLAVFYFITTNAGVVDGESRLPVEQLKNPQIKQLASQVGAIKNGFSSCSGFVKGESCDRLQTAMHCVADESNNHKIHQMIQWSPQQKQYRRASLSAYDVENYQRYNEFDFADLTLLDPLYSCQNPKKTLGNCNGEVYLVGFADKFKGQKIFDRCEQLKISKRLEDLGMVKLSCDVTEGSSGSPVFCLHPNDSVTLLAIITNAGHDEHVDETGQVVSTYNLGIRPWW